MGKGNYRIQYQATDEGTRVIIRRTGGGAVNQNLRRTVVPYDENGNFNQTRIEAWLTNELRQLGRETGQASVG